MLPTTGLPPETGLERAASDRRSPLARYGRHLPTAVIVAAVVAATPTAIRVIGDEAVVALSLDRLRSYDRAEQGGARLGLDDVRPIPVDSPPRAVLAQANLIARAAAIDTAHPGRGPALAQAQADIDRLLAVRPHWADAWVIASVVAAQRGDQRTAVAALDRSYREAGYLRGSGAWRVATAFANWEGLSEQARARSVDEAVWLARIDKRIRDEIFSLARRSPAYRPLLLRWREMRLRDVG
jgi:hypothetical protein